MHSIKIAKKWFYVNMDNENIDRGGGYIQTKVVNFFGLWLIITRITASKTVTHLWEWQ